MRCITFRKNILGFAFGFFGIVSNLFATESKDIQVQEVCEGITIRGKIEPGLSDTEKKLICGGVGAWRNLPPSQIKFNFSNFLQDRGFFHPQFNFEEVKPGKDTAPNLEGRKESTSKEGITSQIQRHLTIDVGSPTIVTSLSAEGAPESLKLERKRKIVGSILTPKLLGSVEEWITQRLNSVGYPCPRLETTANSRTGEIIVRVDAGPLQRFSEITEEGVAGLDSKALRRYDAFHLGDLYDGDLLTVTSNRVLSENFLQATHFTAECKQEGASVHQSTTAGPPRLLTFGVGLDTVGVVRLRSTWRNSRIGKEGSIAQSTLRLSSIDQNIDAFLDWYHLPFSSRRFLRPFFQLQHLNVNAFEIITTRVGLGVGTTYDHGPLGAQILVGPVGEFDRTLRGSGVLNPNTHFTELEANIGLKSHEFEYWATDPRTGYSANFIADFAGAPVGSTSTVQRFKLSGEMLWNYRNYDPPIWIFGLRGGVGTTLSSERPNLSSRIPAHFYWYLGGPTDLRGFSFQSLPTLGAMTFFYLDPELRFTDLPLFGLQPFIFTDIGMTGFSPVSFNSSLLYSPGFGIRYKSPFGVFRTTLARGISRDFPDGWMFYFSFGEEF